MIKDWIRKLYWLAISIVIVIMVALCVYRVSNIRKLWTRVADMRVERIIENADRPVYVSPEGDGSFTTGSYYIPQLELSEATSTYQYKERVKLFSDWQYSDPDVQDFIIEAGSQDIYTETYRLGEDGEVDCMKWKFVGSSIVDMTDSYWELVSRKPAKKLDYMSALDMRMLDYVAAKGSQVKRTSQDRYVDEVDTMQEIVDIRMSTGKDKGWYGNERYAVVEREGYDIYFYVDASAEKESISSDITTEIFMTAVKILVLAIILAIVFKMYERPFVESTEKQRRFVAEAGNDLKAPLTFIRQNLSNLELELGPSEWIDDMRVEAQNMAILLNNLVEMNELEKSEAELAPAQRDPEKTDLSECLSMSISSYEHAAELRGLTFTSEIPEMVLCSGHEKNIRRVLSMLLDNALKYSEGDISVNLIVHDKSDARRRSKPIEVAIENTCLNVDSINFERLFERFYREDEARTAGSSFGIGLSVARALCLQEGADLIAYKAGDQRIGFRVLFQE